MPQAGTKRKRNMGRLNLSVVTDKRIPPNTVLEDGSILQRHIVDITGIKFGKLTAIKPIGRNEKQVIIWLLKCECGNTCTRSTKTITDSANCGCYFGGDFASNHVYYSYRDSARRRGYSFELSKLEFRLLTSGNCYYCGSPPSNVAVERKNSPKFIYSGIDRVDNNIGYVAYNCVPCCKKCNTIKNANHVDDFLGWIESVHTNIHKFEPVRLFNG